VPEIIAVKVEIAVGKLRSYNIIYSADTREKLEYNGTVYQLFIDLKGADDSFKTSILIYPT
jgi:hypothetical protein